LHEDKESSKLQPRGTALAEGGFALLEVLIATTILVLLLVGVGSVLATQASSIGSSRSWGEGNALLNQAMEEIHSLPWSVIQDGLSASDASLCTNPKDPGIHATCSGGSATAATYVANGETIPLLGSGDDAPLTPDHQTSQKVNGIDYTVSAYPTEDSAVSGIMRVTVIVSWTPSPPGSVSSVSAQTLLYPPECIAPGPSNCVYPGPTQPFFYAGASAGDGGAITITGTVDDLPFTQISSISPNAFSSMQIEQTSVVSGAVETSGGAANVAGVSQSVGETTASSAANDAPGSGSSSQSNSSSTNQSTSPLSVLGTLSNDFDVYPGDDTYSTTSTIAASSNPACNDLSGNTQTTGQPCGSGQVSQTSATVSDQLGLNLGGILPLGNTLVSIGAPNPGTSTSAAQSFVARYTSSGSSTHYCDTGGTTSGNGCVHAGAHAAFGPVEIGGLPTALTALFPLGWGTGVPLSGCPAGDYLVALAPFSDTVSAESGVSSTTSPSTGSPSETLCYWNGTGYTATTSALSSAANSISPSVSLTGLVGTNTFGVTITSSFSTGTVSTTTPANGCGTGSPCEESATVSSPIQGSFEYSLTANGTQIADLTVNVNLGQVSASTSYEAA